MRKVERQMVHAIQFRRNYSGRNTKVVTVRDTSRVFLHGNLIAVITPTEVTFDDNGYRTLTTYSRINAIAGALLSRFFGRRRGMPSANGTYPRPAATSQPQQATAQEPQQQSSRSKNFIPNFA